MNRTRPCAECAEPTPNPRQICDVCEPDYRYPPAHEGDLAPSSFPNPENPDVND